MYFHTYLPCHLHGHWHESFKLHFSEFLKIFSLPRVPTTIALTFKASLTKLNTAMPAEHASLFLYFETLMCNSPFWVIELVTLKGVIVKTWESVKEAFKLKVDTFLWIVSPIILKIKHPLNYGSFIAILHVPWQWMGGN